MEKIVALMPNGDTEEFDSVEEFEDAYYDMIYELNNEFEIEWPDYA